MLFEGVCTPLGRMRGSGVGEPPEGSEEDTGPFDLCLMKITVSAEGSGRGGGRLQAGGP